MKVNFDDQGNEWKQRFRVWQQEREFAKLMQRKKRNAFSMQLRQSQKGSRVENQSVEVVKNNRSSLYKTGGLDSREPTERTMSEIVVQDSEPADPQMVIIEPENVTALP